MADDVVPDGMRRVKAADGAAFQEMTLILAAVRRLKGEGDWPAPEDWLGLEERARLETLDAPTRRRQFIGARWHLRALLAQRFGGRIEEWRLNAADGVAPTLMSAPVPVAQALFLSLAHSGDLVACAISDEPVGIDVETARTVRSAAVERAGLVLSPEEWTSWRAPGQHDPEAALALNWVCKEAWFKARSPQPPAWDFRRLSARSCAPAQANVRVWSAPPLQVAVCCAGAGGLAQVECEGLAAAAATSTFWHVSAAAASP